ncbi:MAG: SCP2 sterol-binding domain-containing protein [Actinomycetes bacterium]
MSIPDVATLRTRAAAIPAGTIPDDLEARFSVVVEGGEAWTLVLGGGRARIEAGAAGDVVIHIDRPSAERIAAGRTNAQRTIAAGGIRIEGDLAALPPPRSLDTLGALLGPDPTATPVPSDDQPRRNP